MRLQKEHYIIFIILFIGVILRLWGINFGLPFQFHQDEPIIVNHAMAYGTGDLNPHFFIIPPLTSYILFVFYGAYFLLLKVAGAVTSPELFATGFLKDPAIFYIIGRFVVGFIPSVVSVYLTYKIASKLFSKRAALFAALAMAVTFLNVVNSHYIYADNLLVMFCLLSYVAMVLLIQRPIRRNYIASSILIGLAIATKYNGAILLPSFLLTHILVVRSANIKRVINADIAVSVVVIIGTFLVCNPFSLLDWRFFLDSMLHNTGGVYRGWGYHIKYSLFEGTGSLVTIAGIIGLISLVKEKRSIGIFLILFPFFFYLHLVFASQAYSRYVLCVIPFLLIGAGFLFFDLIYPKIKSNIGRFLLIAITTVLIIPTFVKSIKADILFFEKDTRIEAMEWIKSNIGQGSKIAIDNRFYGPPLKQTLEQLQGKRDIVNRQPELSHLKITKLNLAEKALKNEQTYNIYYLLGENEEPGRFLSLWPMIKEDINILRREGIEYVVFNNILASQKAKALREEIEKEHEILCSFNPYKSKEAFRGPYDKIGVTSLPIGSRELYSRKKPGPYILIYKIR